jgi:hypothetical protein
METISLQRLGVILTPITLAPFVPPLDVAPPPGAVVAVAGTTLIVLCVVVIVIVGVCLWVLWRIKKSLASKKNLQ